jgi:uncharacterized glyoxalase superfamily protein PhnB/predicted kinase
MAQNPRQMPASSLRCGERWKLPLSSAARDAPGMKATPELVPLLVVQGARRAIDFYVRALGAKVLARYEHGPERHVSHADLSLSGALFALTEEARAWNSDAPPSLGGSPVVLQLHVADAEAAASAMLDAGATIVFPVQELLGERMARVRDPFGHLWILRQCLEELSVDEIQGRRDELFARFASQPPAKDANTLRDSGRSRQAPNAPRIHLVIGPVGAGKSTFALGLARDHGALRLTLDDWMARLFRPDRPETGVVEWYVERAARCVDQIWTLTEAMLELGTDVVLEICLLKRGEREDFYRRVADAGCELAIHVLDASRDVRRERVEARNQARGSTFSMVVPPAIFELASDLWEPLEPDECAGRDVRFLRTDAA